MRADNTCLPERAQSRNHIEAFFWVGKGGGGSMGRGSTGLHKFLKLSERMAQNLKQEPKQGTL